MLVASAFTVSAVIHRPIDEVFAFVTDARNNPQWQSDTGLLRIQQIPEEPVGVGTRIVEARKFMGMQFETTSEVTAYVPGSVYTRHGIGASGPLKEATTRFEPVADGTRVTVDVQVEAGGLLSIAEPLLVSNMKQGFESTLVTLKALLERQPLEHVG